MVQEPSFLKARQFASFSSKIPQKKIFTNNQTKSQDCATLQGLDSSGLKSVYEKFRFHDGLVWTVSLTVEIKLRFHISLALCGRRVSLYFLFLELIDDTL